MSGSLAGLKVSGLFAGIGGLDLGFQDSGADTQLLCEIDPNCQNVLETRFTGVRIHSDVTTLRKIPKTDLLTAGFPCQDISLAGTRLGLAGKRSGLVNEVFRLIEKSRPEFFLIENVLNLLRINQGEAMRSILRDIDLLGYKWAYRVVDSRGFGLPQRRQRVIIFGTRGSANPALMLFAGQAPGDIQDKIPLDLGDDDHGFYWTEGKRGIGWAINAVPTIKGGSGLGIPSPPAVYSHRHKFVGTPSIEDAERLQGFPAGWTDLDFKAGVRWKMVGNAVSTPISSWVANEISMNRFSGEHEFAWKPFPTGSIPSAGANVDGTWKEVSVSKFVFATEHDKIGAFLHDPLTPLSVRALSGYLKRVREGERRLPAGFIGHLEEQLLNSEGISKFSL